MYQTKHDLPAHTRAEVIGILNARLADQKQPTTTGKEGL